MTDPDELDDPFGAFAVERVTREDGRYLLYYVWADESDPATHLPDAAPAPAADARPWSPETEPRTDV